MSASSSSGGKEARLPDLTFPILEPVPEQEIPARQDTANLVIELSEIFLPLAAGRPEFEARRLELKTRSPFRFLDEAPPARADREEPL